MINNEQDNNTSTSRHFLNFVCYLFIIFCFINNNNNNNNIYLKYNVKKSSIDYKYT